MSETTSTSAAAVSAAAPDCGCGHPASFHTPHCYDVCGCEVFHTAAAPDDREATPDEAHDIGYVKGHTDGYREAMAALAARPAPTVNAADVEREGGEE